MVTGMVRKMLAVAVVCACLAPAPAWGWGEDGHVIVAKIAELNLSDDARVAIHDLLGPTSISEPQIAVYADKVKHNPNFPQYKKSPPWHFVDIPEEADGYDEERDCKEGACVVGKIEQFKKTLADKNRPESERREALVFLVHLVGDIHQPLHCATRNDRGGNALHVRFLGEGGNHLNLHSVWDDNLVLACMGHFSAPNYGFHLAQQIKPQDRQAWQAGEPKDWANESHKAAVDVAYRAGNGDVELPSTGQPNLDEDYVKRGKVTVNLQLQKGGIRLARVLNDALAP